MKTHHPALGSDLWRFVQTCKFARQTAVGKEGQHMVVSQLDESGGHLFKIPSLSGSRRRTGPKTQLPCAPGNAGNGLDCFRKIRAPLFAKTMESVGSSSRLPWPVGLSNGDTNGIRQQPLPWRV
ncbi:hypothetical protein AS026_02895 [Rhizobium altiplani]|uniref:Uncharacterized protein n=1 Tax=Rhizobium altiplani TaxID=1864509 RepID=A0A120FMK4_9HYPH|nr:hypothetical protein AS026_02895 [Rhizobium altiplani]